ncbi:zinc finger protein basonuclin-1-like [Melanotaenia boesemani]|uniref:zinc finger protein basonuclin-1-like n=1 Tax=Melanotaenia boesemani TaxID=1250792 RepID=UPI001C04B119|nr:zinc finger protein basonuclin-1-like [Melanotaenia boesemani]
MVFSSLRSRNRHSANPNPRLHMGSSRDAHPHRNTHYVDTEPHIPDVKQTHEDIHDTRMRRERETSNSLWHQVDDAHATRKNSHTNHHGYRHNTTLQVDPSPSPQALSQDTNQIISLKTHPAPPPPRHQSSSSSPSCSPVVIPEQDPLTNNASSTSLLFNPAPFTMVSYKNQSVTRHFDVAEGSVCTSLLTSQWWPWQSADPVPKKKPRKSRMPVKIERQRLDSRGHNEEES